MLNLSGYTQWWATTIAECSLLPRRGLEDPTQGKRVTRTMPEVPRSPRGVLVNSTLGTADSGPDRAIIMFVASPTLSKCPVWRSEWVCGTQPSGASPNFSTLSIGFPTVLLQFCYSFATVAPSMGFLQSVSRARCGKHDTVRRQSLPSFLHRLTHHWFDHCSAITLEISKNKQRSGKHDTVCRPAIILTSSSIVVHCSLLLRLKLKDLEELIVISQFE